jgi:hypothetical protein
MNTTYFAVTDIGCGTLKVVAFQEKVPGRIAGDINLGAIENSSKVDHMAAHANNQ